MAQCSEDACALPTADEQSFTVYTDAGPLVFKGCPRSHLDADARKWIAAHGEWKLLGANPVQLGRCTAEELDPRWYEAVLVIEAESKRCAAEAAKPSPGR